MSFVQKLEAFLSEAEAEASAAEHALIAWIKRLLHHQKIGDTITLPPQAGTGDGTKGIGSGTAATPVVEPLPPPPSEPVAQPTPHDAVPEPTAQATPTV